MASNSELVEICSKSLCQVNKRDFDLDAADWQWLRQCLDIIINLCSNIEFTSFCEIVSEWVSSFFTAHQHILGYLVPYNGEKVKKCEDTIKAI